MQQVVTPDGWIIPLHIRDGLTYMDMCPPMDYEINNYDHVIFTSDVAWDPSLLDNETDFGILNNNLNLNHGDLHFGARLSDNRENGTQRIIAKMLTKNYYGGKQLSVLNREDILSEYGVVACMQSSS